MSLTRTLRKFARCESGAFTTDWVIQAAVVGAICVGVLNSVSKTDTGYHTAVAQHNGRIVMSQYP